MALKNDGVNIINGINYGAFTEALNNKVDRNLANLDNGGQAILDEKMDIDFTNISAIGQAVLDKKVEIEALLEGNGYAKFSWKDGNKISKLIICWGINLNQTNITFSTTFSNNKWILVTAQKSPTPPSLVYSAISVNSETTTGFNWTKIDGAVRQMYLVVGY